MKMTDAEWQKEARKLKGAITRAKNRALLYGTLDEKLAQKAKAQELEELLRLHKLNYFELLKSL